MTAMMSPSGGFPDSGEILGGVLGTNKDSGEQVVELIVNQLINDLNINTGDISRNLCAELLKTNLRKLLLGRHGVLDNYNNGKLEDLLPEIYLNFDLEPKDIDIDKNHGSHAKLYSITKAIKKRYDISTPKRKRTLEIHEFGKRELTDSQCETMSAG